MNDVVCEIDGIKVKTFADNTILKTAKDAGVEIPNLCNDGRLKPYGACRVCLVDVEGARCPVPACATKVSDGMIVRTNTDEIIDLRKNVVELILSDHPNDCMICDKCGECKLQDIAYQLGVRGEKYDGEKHPEEEQQPNPMIKRDGSKCILCGRCARICDEVQGASALDFVHRGFEAIVTTPFNRAYHETSCVLCGQCVSTCPTGALLPVRSLGRSWEVKKVDTICSYCGCGCTLTLHVEKDIVLGVSTKEGQGVSNGNTCIKGKFGWDFINHPDRLRTPLIKRNGKLEEATWDEAIKLVADKLLEIKKKHGSDSIAGLASAKCTNEENYIMQKFMRAVIGTNNIDHCARLCHAPSVAGLAKAFGSGAATGSITDIENARAIFIIGSNTTEAHPIIGLAVKKAADNGATVVVADPRKIEVTKYAKYWLRQRPGTDIMLINALSKVIIEEGLEDSGFIKERTEGFEELKNYLAKLDLNLTEKITGVKVEDIKLAAKSLAEADGICILYAMGITQHICGTDNVLAVANLAMLTGSIGRENVGVFPLRGQNNVQGSCDAGALPGVFSGYQSVCDDEIRAKFEKAWSAKLPADPGKTVVEFINMAESGEIKAMYIMAENPMLSDPDIGHTKEALENLDFLVVQDIFLTETAKLADVVLPGSSFAEKQGVFTNTERRMQLVRKAIGNVGDSRQDWQILCDIANAMGYKMKYNSSSEIMDEMARLTPIFGGVSHKRLENRSIQWPCLSVEECEKGNLPAEIIETEILDACPVRVHPGTKTLHVGKFARGKGLFSAIGHIPPAEEIDENYPIVLTTGRMLQHYHTGTMSRRAKAINEVFPEGYIEISKVDAGELKIKDGEEITAQSRRGQIKVKAKVTDRVDKGVAFIPFHFWESPANMLTNAALDKDAKIPELKVCAIRISKNH